MALTSISTFMSHTSGRSDTSPDHDGDFFGADFFFFKSSLLLSSSTRRRFTLSDVVDKPWSQVSSLLSPGTYLIIHRA